MLAPDAMTTYVMSRTLELATHFFTPAMARAPAGSSTQRVSVKPSLIAAQISSLLTVT